MMQKFHFSKDQLTIYSLGLADNKWLTKVQLANCQSLIC